MQTATNFELKGFSSPRFAKSVKLWLLFKRIQRMEIDFTSEWNEEDL